MLELYNDPEDEPRSVLDGEWHIPFDGQFDELQLEQIISKDEKNEICGKYTYMRYLRYNFILFIL